MLTVDEKTSVGNCSHCGEPAQWNTPAIDTNGNLWCDGCKDKDRTGIFFLTIDQHKVNGSYKFDGGVALNGVIVHADKSTWIEGGSRSTYLSKAEKNLSVNAIAYLLNEEYNVNKIIRCTGCGMKMNINDVASYPLFAGVACKECTVKHKQKLDNERKMGHVCGMCGQPYGNCCC